MRFGMLALYAGPDQIMAVTSGLAGVIGVLLIFWNKTVAALFRILRFFRRSPQTSGVAKAQRSANQS